MIISTPLSTQLREIETLLCGEGEVVGGVGGIQTVRTEDRGRGGEGPERGGVLVRAGERREG